MTELRVYEIPGKPIAWARAVPGRRCMYDSQKQLKLLFGLCVKKQHKGGVYEGPLLLEATFYFSMPLSKKKQWDKMRNTPHTQVPDTSNCIKFLEDAICGILINDDRIISDIHARKIWANEGKTVFRLIQL
jgi:Holliday junction resolvase RusA-like endonuclease